MPGVKSVAEVCWATAKDVFLEYAGNSTVHGVSYIAEKGRSWFEKGLWIIVLSLSVIGCGKLILDAWNISPIIITFAGKPIPIWQIPFPAVTICPLSFAQSDRINITKLVLLEQSGLAISYPTEKEKLLTLAKAVFCNENLVFNDFQNTSDCNECMQSIREIRVPVEEMFVGCKYRNREIDCKESFRETVVMTYHYCYTFNDFGVYRKRDHHKELEEQEQENWNVDEGYKSTASMDAKPYRVVRAGQKYGFSLLMRNNKDNRDEACSLAKGFALEYHLPYDSPQFTTNFFQLPMSASINLILSPKMLLITDGVRSYAPNKRKCYLRHEQNLKYFKEYTQKNCEIECQVDLTLENCGCLPIYIEKPKDVNICGPALHRCINNAANILLARNYLQCNCLPACSTISYDSEVSMANLNSSASVSNREERFEYSEVKIFFRENQVLYQQRAELYGFVDFMANCGGLLGLCLGVSVISVLELAYICTIRLWCAFQKKKLSNSFETVYVEDFKKNKTNQYLKTLKATIKDYVAKTTIHGIKHVTESNLSVIERIWVTCVFAISVFCCGSLINDVFRRYNQAPMTISYANEETPVSEIPFPAVTICPQVISNNVAQMYAYFKVQNLSLYDLNDHYYRFAEAIAQTCDSGVFNDIDPANRSDCETCVDTLKLLMGGVEQGLYHCVHIYKQNRCKDMFKAIVTESGVCFVYNSFDVFRRFNGTTDEITEQWTLEGGYRNNTDLIDIHPRAGSKSALNIFTFVAPEMVDGVCKGALQAFKVYLHLPNEAPQITKQFYLMSFNYSTRILLNPQVTVTVPELRNFPVAKRQCYFNNERYLRFFRHFTQNNCEIECLVNLTLRMCGCLMFHIPRIPGVKLCGNHNLKCQQLAVHRNAEKNINELNSECHCLPTCFAITYDTEINQIYRQDSRNFAELGIAFRKNQFVALKRSQLYGKTELLANCGGLLGLFLGFSILSIVELIYFCTFRLICNYFSVFEIL